MKNNLECKSFRVNTVAQVIISKAFAAISQSLHAVRSSNKVHAKGNSFLYQTTNFSRCVGSLRAAIYTRPVTLSIDDYHHVFSTAKYSATYQKSTDRLFLVV